MPGRIGLVPGQAGLGPLDNYSHRGPEKHARQPSLLRRRRVPHHPRPPPPSPRRRQAQVEWRRVVTARVRRTKQRGVPLFPSLKYGRASLSVRDPGSQRPCSCSCGPEMRFHLHLHVYCTLVQKQVFCIYAWALSVCAIVTRNRISIIADDCWCKEYDLI